MWIVASPTKLVDAIFDGLKAQTVTVPGITIADIVIPRWNTIAEEVEELLQDLPVVLSLDVHARGWHQSRPPRPNSNVGDCSVFRTSGGLGRQRPGYAKIGDVDLW